MTVYIYRYTSIERYMYIYTCVHICIGVIHIHMYIYRHTCVRTECIYIYKTSIYA